MLFSFTRVLPAATEEVLRLLSAVRVDHIEHPIGWKGVSSMAWYIAVAHFFAGAFLSNGVPHFVNGISGRRFPTPFASPPGVGLSSATLNVAWGFANFVIGSALLAGIGGPSSGPDDWFDALIVGAGALAMALILSQAFGRRASTAAVRDAGS